MRLMCLLSHWYITFRQRCPFRFNTHSDLFRRTYKRNTRNQPILDRETQFNISFLLGFQIVIRICLLLSDEKQITSKIFISFFFFFRDEMVFLPFTVHISFQQNVDEFLLIYFHSPSCESFARFGLEGWLLKVLKRILSWERNLCRGRIQ